MKVQISIASDGADSLMYAAEMTIVKDTVVLTWTQLPGPEETQPAGFCLTYMRPGKVLRILRSGDYQTDLTFTEGQRTRGTLILQEGSFMMEIETRQIILPDRLWSYEGSGSGAACVDGEDDTIILRYNMLLMDQEPISKEIAIHVFLD